jgi:hypothetical protein
MDAKDVARVMFDVPCVLFLGSGISIPDPSGLPSAYDLATVFLKELGVGVLSEIVIVEILKRGILPEFLYGLCERHFGPKVYEVWQSLELWRRHSPTMSSNAGHLAAVHVSARWGTPILTPNFDTFLEAAAKTLGIVADVAIARPGAEFRPAITEAGRTAIWKLHGSAGDASTVFSSVRALTAPTLKLRERIRAAVSEDAQLILAGYSGRDLDLFPLLASEGTKRAPIWIDRSFDPDHRFQHLAVAARPVTASFNDVAKEYAGLDRSDLLHSVVQTDIRASSKHYKPTKDVLNAEIATEFERIADQLDDHAARCLLFAELLINCGLASEAVDLTYTITTSTEAQRTECARLRAKALWELGKFRQSRDVSRVRAGEARTRAEKATMKFAILAAEARENIPPRGLPDARPVSRSTLIRSAFSATALLAASAVPAMRPVRIPEPTRTPFVEGWLEHAVRVLIGAHYVVARPDGSVSRFPRLILVPSWKWIRKQCLRVGYAEGIGNAGRYLERMQVAEPGDLRAVHDFLGHKLGIALAHRDAAQRAFGNGDIAAAVIHYEKGMSIADRQSDPVLRLTFMSLARDLGLPFDRMEISLASVEAEWASEYLSRRR